MEHLQRSKLVLGELAGSLEIKRPNLRDRRFLVEFLRVEVSGRDRVEQGVDFGLRENVRHNEGIGPPMGKLSLRAEQHPGPARNEYVMLRPRNDTPNPTPW